MTRSWTVRLASALALVLAAVASAQGYDGLVEKKTFELRASRSTPIDSSSSAPTPSST